VGAPTGQGLKFAILLAQLIGCARSQGFLGFVIAYCHLDSRYIRPLSHLLVCPDITHNEIYRDTRIKKLGTTVS